MESYALNMNNSPDQPLTPDTIELLNNTLSKLGINILKELYNTPHMQQKNLAANIHTSVTSLSNILSRLESIQPSLLVSERTGRSKYYSLTETARLYVAKVILPQTNKIHPFTTLSHENTLVSETFDILFQFQEKAGSVWDIWMDDLLTGRNVTDCPNELFTLYSDFISHMSQLEILHQTAYIHEIHSILGQHILVARLNDHLHSELKSFRCLEPLFDLENQDFDKATQLIDHIFSNIAPEFFADQADDNFDVNSLISNEQYCKVFFEINSMKNDFRNPKYKGNKQLILKYWKTKYIKRNHSLSYIAEKCSFLYSCSRPQGQSFFK